MNDIERIIAEHTEDITIIEKAKTSIANNQPLSKEERNIIAYCLKKELSFLIDNRARYEIQNGTYQKNKKDKS